MAQLVPVEGSPVETHIWQAGARTVGRGAECDIVVRHALVSRTHCRVELKEDGAWVTDLGSRNGTFLNGRRVLGSHSLVSGDVVDIGGWKARFELGAIAENATFVIVDRGSRRTLRGGLVTIGRASTADVVIRDPAMSRVHATIAYGNGVFILRDAGSTNGSFVVGQRVVTRQLAHGDTIAFSNREAGPAGDRSDQGSDGGLAVDGTSGEVTVEVVGDTCTITVGKISFDDVATQDLDTTGLSGKPPTSHVLTQLLRLAEQEGDATTGPLVIQAPVRGKALHKSGKWVPTSDIAPSNRLRVAVGTMVVLSCMVGTAAIQTARPEVVATGAVRAGHRSVAFQEKFEGTDLCRACHDPWRGVSDHACTACHVRPAAPPHDKLTHCSGCHREHGSGTDRRLAEGAAPRDDSEVAGQNDRVGSAGVTPDPMTVPRHRCTDCHRTAHDKRVERAPGASLSFLNRGFSTTLVHTDHRLQACLDCHVAGPDGAVDKRVRVGCEGCHGGGAGMADARCATCHPFHERQEAEVTARDDSASN